MPKYIVEREIPGAGNLSPNELQSISQKSCSILDEMGPQIRWIESYLTENKLYCVYIAPDEEAIHNHAQRGEFPINHIAEVRGMIDPKTAKS